MSKYFLTLSIALLLAGLTFAQKPGSFEFESKTYKFGKVKEGEFLEFSYVFTNVGDQPIVIQDIKVACSCTKVYWPDHPIPPGARDTIEATFDTAGKIAYQERNLDIISNADKSPYKLKFKGVVDNKQ